MISPTRMSPNPLFAGVFREAPNDGTETTNFALPGKAQVYLTGAAKDQYDKVLDLPETDPTKNAQLWKLSQQLEARAKDQYDSADLS